MLANFGYLGKNHRENIRYLDVELIEKFKDRLVFYYSSDDSSVPDSYFVDLKEKFKDVEAYLDDKGIEHCFCLNYSNE